MWNDEFYEIRCSRGHTNRLTIDELEDVLEWEYCPSCGDDIVSVEPSVISVECPFCTWRESTHWQDAACYLSCLCPECGEHTQSHIYLSDSYSFKLACKRTLAPRYDSKEFEMKNRPDMWKLVIHFCSKSEFSRILGSRTIMASPTGYFKCHGVTAVCLTETPLAYCDDIRTRHGQYGFAFYKLDIIEGGGQTTLELTDELITAQKKQGGFCAEVRPFINVIRPIDLAGTDRRPFYFQHEREWRFPGDIRLDTLKPVGLITPSDNTATKYISPQGKDFLDWITAYGEIIQHSSPAN